MIQPGERKAELQLVFAIHGEGVALVVGAIGPLLLDPGDEGLVGIREGAAGGVLGAAPGVGDGAGEAFGRGMLQADLKRIRNPAPGWVEKLRVSPLKMLLQTCFAAAPFGFPFSGAPVARFVTVSRVIPPFPQTRVA